MHIIKQQQNQVTLFWRNGYFERFPSHKAVLARYGYGWLARNVGKEFREYSHTEWYTADGIRLFFGCRVSGEDVPVRPRFFYRDAPCVMRDDAGRRLTVADLAVGRTTLTGPARWARDNPELARWNGWGPVPKIRKERGGDIAGRNPRVANAIRGSVTFEEEGEVPVRKKRQHRYLNPFADYDDYYASMRTVRNWKQYRRTQWKVKP